MSQPDIRTKGVHVKLDKETHMNFKTQLIKHGVSMQEAFEEFARLVGSDNATTNRLLERFIRTRVREELASVGSSPFNAGRKRKFTSELDPDALYNLINEEGVDEDSQQDD